MWYVRVRAWNIVLEMCIILAIKQHEQDIKKMAVRSGPVAWAACRRYYTRCCSTLRTWTLHSNYNTSISEATWLNIAVGRVTSLLYMWVVTGFKSLSANRLSRVKFFVVCLSPSKLIIRRQSVALTSLRKLNGVSTRTQAVLSKCIYF